MTAPPATFTDVPEPGGRGRPPHESARAADAPAGPAPNDVVAAFAGLATLGLAAGAGAGELVIAARAAPLVLFVGAGALMLTAPALIVAHQFLGLRARPDALVGAIAHGFVGAGRLALGLAAPTLFFSATSGLWLALFPVFVATVGAFGFADAIRRLLVAEGPGVDLDGVRMVALVAGWAALTVAIALRLSWDVGAFVLGHP